MKYDNLPPIVSQSIESLLDPATSDIVKFNNFQTIVRIRDGCNFAMYEYNKSMKKR